MVAEEARDEIIAMVIARLEPLGERDAGLGARSGEQIGPQLLFEERVTGAGIDEQLGQPRAVLDQRDRVIGAPGIALRPR
jgi:hypothetical protein